MIYFASDSLAWGFFGAIVCYIITLILADITAKKFQTFYKDMDGISIPQPFCAGFAPFAWAINKGLDKIPGIEKLEIDAEGMKKKFGRKVYHSADECEMPVVPKVDIDRSGCLGDEHQYIHPEAYGDNESAGLCIGIRLGDALKSGLKVGVGFIGLSIVTALLTQRRSLLCGYVARADTVALYVCFAELRAYIAGMPRAISAMSPMKMLCGRWLPISRKPSGLSTYWCYVARADTVALYVCFAELRAYIAGKHLEAALCRGIGAYCFAAKLAHHRAVCGRWLPISRKPSGLSTYW